MNDYEKILNIEELNNIAGGMKRAGQKLHLGETLPTGPKMPFYGFTPIKLQKEIIPKALMSYLGEGTHIRKKISRKAEPPLSPTEILSPSDILGFKENNSTNSLTEIAQNGIPHQLQAVYTQFIFFYDPTQQRTVANFILFMQSPEVEDYCKRNGLSEIKGKYISILQSDSSRLEEEADEVIGWNSY